MTPPTPNTWGLTLKSLMTLVRRRSEKEPGCSCLIWQGACSNEGRDPRFHPPGTKVNAVLRRLIWALAHPGEALAPGEVVVASCKTLRCVLPEHLEKMTQSQHKSGRKKTAAHALKVALAKCRVPDETVAAIKASEASSYALERELGVSASTVRRIRNGTRPADRAGSPWAGLGARG